MFEFPFFVFLFVAVGGSLEFFQVIRFLIPIIFPEISLQRRLPYPYRRAPHTIPPLRLSHQRPHRLPHRLHNRQLILYAKSHLLWNSSNLFQFLILKEQSFYFFSLNLKYFGHLFESVLHPKYCLSDVV